MYKIYKIEYIPTGEVVYIGKTKNELKVRFWDHCKDKYAIMHAPIQKYGKQNFRIIQIDSANDNKEADEKECFWTLFELKLGTKLYNRNIGQHQSK